MKRHLEQCTRYPFLEEGFCALRAALRTPTQLPSIAHTWVLRSDANRVANPNATLSASFAASLATNHFTALALLWP
jgi:hypothetical protein